MLFYKLSHVKFIYYSSKGEERALMAFGNLDFLPPIAFATHVCELTCLHRCQDLSFFGGHFDKVPHMYVR